MFLVRHGETEWSKSGQHTSRTDLPLTPTGEAVALALKPLLAGVHPVLALSSPLQRARRTAELAGVPVELDENLREVDYGDYEGITTPQIRERDPDWSVWTAPNPGGETIDQAGERTDHVLDRVRKALPEGNVVLFAHGHILRVLGARWLGLPASEGRLLALDTATISVLGTEHDLPVIRRWNAPAAWE
ncbi:histidine phosphatase family protein [Cryptosporangium phraense]|uniref:Histidine phosphatase family protein n=1 Tax=Cryptosporangium phraense TaxID=2593070 RepID=A0A545ALZ7_9ACTN|nr:histidine phosphatase family protein [Cryptosporangium phraense]